MVFDLTTNPATVIATIPTGQSPDFDGPNGVAPCIASASGRAFTDANCGDLRADEMSWDEKDKILLVTNGDPGKNSSAQESKGQDTSDPMHTTGTLHHPALRIGPVLLLGQQPDVCPLQDRGQMPVLGLGGPQRRAFRQTKLRLPPTGLSLLAGQPVAQGAVALVPGISAFFPGFSPVTRPESAASARGSLEWRGASPVK